MGVAWRAVLLGAIAAVTAGDGRSLASIPDVEIPRFGRVVLVGSFACGSRCNGMIYGDFDGDGSLDYGYPIQEWVDSVAGRVGLRIHLRGPLAHGGDVLEIGAGQSPSNGQPDFAGVNSWSVVRHAELKKLWPGRACPPGDGIVLEQYGSFRGVVGLSRGRLVWRSLQHPR